MDTDEKKSARAGKRIESLFIVVLRVALVIVAILVISAYREFGFYGVLVGFVILQGLTDDLPRWLRRKEKRRRAREGQCLKCGYDLRGSQESKVCPECGGPIAKPKS